MKWLVRLFPAYRALETVAANQSEQVESLESALREEIRAHNATKEELESVQASATMEQVRRISAEAIASERQREIDRLLDSVRDLRDDIKTLTSERIKSVDNINLKLMEAKIPEQPVDFAAHRHDERLASVNLRRSLVGEVRRTHQAIDHAILRESLKGFPKRHMNEVVKPDIGIIPTLEQIEKTDITTEAAI